MSDRRALALSAVRRRPGCSAWALGVLMDPPEGLSAAEWRALLEEELPKLHAEGKVEATVTGLEFRRRWPRGAEIPPGAGAVLVPNTEAA